MGEKRFYIPKRYLLTALGFFGIVNLLSLRTSLGVAIVAMVNSTAKSFSNSTDFTVECPKTMLQTQETKFGGTQYNWNAQQQGLILGAFYIGYLITQLPGGYLSMKYGAKWIIGGAVLNSAILALLSPLTISWNVNAFIIVRVFQGLGEGMIFPAFNLMMSHWSPIMERSRLSTVICSGVPIGSVLSMLVSGWLGSSNLLGGWPSVFYLFGTTNCIWFVFWAFLAYESPSVHPTISLQELQYNQEDSDEQSQNKSEIPWKAVFSSLPMWAVLVAHTGNSLGAQTFITELPTYLNDVLHFDVKENGLLSASPFAAQAVVSLIASYIADLMRKSNTMTITNIRKMFNTIGFIGPAVCLLVITESGCRPYLIVCLITVGMALNGCIYSGFNVIHIDMSPAFAGTMYAITNLTACLNGFIGPAMVGAFTDSGATIVNWNYVFYIITGTYIVTAVFFAAFASAELQPWATGKKELSPVSKF